jgi:hypothetical protein
MSPGWVAPLMLAAGFACLGIAASARAAEHPPRAWAIERCHADQCEVLPARYSGPTACNLDVASERIGKQQKDGTRLVCIRTGGK